MNTLTPLDYVKRSAELNLNDSSLSANIASAKSLDDITDLILKNQESFFPRLRNVNFNNEANNTFLKEHLSEFLDKLDIGIWIMDASEFYLYVNQGLLDLSCTPDKQIMLGACARNNSVKFDILMPDIIKAEGRPLTAYQDVYNKITGDHYRQLITQTPIYDSDGKLKYIIAIVERLSHLNERLKEAQENHIKYVIKNSNEVQDQDIIAESPQMKEILSIIRQISSADVPILIEGESGTGKEIIANQIHKSSTRKSGPLIAVNCSAIPDSLFESELFGYEKGAFTGANSSGKVGLLEQANGGTLFLDEINSMPLSAQGKLLRVLETKTFRRVGGTKNITSNFRIISATNQNLLELSKEKQFRDDLLYRLNIIPLRIPPLRNRKEDIIPLAEHFLKLFSDIHSKNKAFSSNAISELLNYTWPGNVRELRNFIERVVVTSGSDVIEIDNITKLLKNSLYPYEVYTENTSLVPDIAPGFSLSDYISKKEAEVIKLALEKTSTTYEAAELLGISQSTFVKKKQKYNL